MLPRMPSMLSFPNRLLSTNGWMSAGIVISVVGAAFALKGVIWPLNGSLFYMPPLVAMLVFGALWAKQRFAEPYLLVGAACFFALAIVARSSDWMVPWQFGTHFLWHLLNGIVVYAALRTWIIATSANLLATSPAA